MSIDWNKLRTTAGPYPPEAFQFVRDGLSHTVKMVHGEGAAEPQLVVPGEGGPPHDRHVSPRQLCMGLRDLAIRKYGMLARTVLSRWGVRRTDDFGKIVFAMIEAGLLRKSDQDSFEDFLGVYDFDEAFTLAEVN